ncbi:MAG: DNA polymerase III subunit alpha [Planctomycetota bacterium]|nr:MAG: DNA polymerase III subunit alpha [Planctomycetota bacterium]
MSASTWAGSAAIDPSHTSPINNQLMHASNQRTISSFLGIAFSFVSASRAFRMHHHTTPGRPSRRWARRHQAGTMQEVCPATRWTVDRSGTARKLRRLMQIRTRPRRGFQYDVFGCSQRCCFERLSTVPRGLDAMVACIAKPCSGRSNFPVRQPVRSHGVTDCPSDLANMKYVELHCKSNFSFLEGASHADELIQRAGELGYSGLAITDRNSLAGIVRGYTAARDAGLPYYVGAELHPVDGPPLVVWPGDRQAYGRLCRLITRGRLRREKGGCELYWSDVAELNEGMLAGLLLRQPVIDETPPAEQQHFDDSNALPWEAQDALPDCDAGSGSGYWQSQVGTHVGDLQLPPATFDPRDDAGWLKWLHLLRDLFGDRGYLLMELHQGVDDTGAAARLAHLSRVSGVPLLAGGDIHYHVAERSLLHDALLATRFNTTIDQIASQRLANSLFHLRRLDEVQRTYRAYPQAVARTLEVAERLQFRLDQLRYQYPVELAPDGQRPIDFLKRLTWQGAKRRYPDGVPAKIIGLLKHEMELIEELGYEAYFLTVWDLVRFARSRGILCQGRGSAANSVVCYCLGITSVDPNRMDLLFERFISRERNEAPDIDVDFEHQRREEVLQYIYEKYGRHRTGMTATVITYRTKSAIRDCARALGISLDRIDALSRLVDAHLTEGSLAERAADCGIDPDSEVGRRFLYLVEHLIGFPRHLSQHVGGMVMTQEWLCELCPIENASMEGRTVIQWNKDDLDDLGILKVDCLSLGMLSAIHRAFDLIEDHYDRSLTLASVPAEDEGVYDMICAADTIGVFQIESRAQMSMLPRLRPRCFYDLVIEVAIVRPGPIQGQMVHPYLQARRSGQQPEYPNQAIRDVLAKTMGVPIFQEQAMRLAVVAAGFTPGEADQLRRAMAAWRRPGLIDQFHRKLIDGMRANGLTQEFAERVFTQIRGFGEYGFPESHAASFALLVYVSAWLKCYYPDAFCAALLNSQPMGFYAPAQLVRDAREHGVEVRSVCVNASDWECTLEPTGTTGQRCALRLGLLMIRGLPESVGRNIVAVRATGGPFRDLADFARRTEMGQATLTRLADAGALSSLAGDRRAAYWQTLAHEKKPASMPLFEAAGADADDPIPEALQPMDEIDEVYTDFATTGLSLRKHPVAFIRPQLDRWRVVPAKRLSSVRDGRFVRVAGLVILRQRPSTAKGITFVTLEDETGVINLVVKPEVWQRHYRIARRSNAWLVHGVLENREGIVHVVVARLHDLTEQIGTPDQRSRDFH